MKPPNFGPRHRHGQPPASPPLPLDVAPADLFLTHGSGLISRLIRLCSTPVGRDPDRVSHVGLIITGGPAGHAHVIEALARVRRHRLYYRYGPHTRQKVAIYRARKLTPEQAHAVVSTAHHYLGRAYGNWKILAHFLDWLLLRAYLFRRFATDGRYPICSWLVAYTYAKADIHFGVPPEEADPDDIWAYIRNHPDEFEEIWPLAELPPM